MSNVELQLHGEGYTTAQALIMKDEILAYAATNGMKGQVLIIEPLQ